jgi:trk system potassium uptake protein TrkA
MKQYLVIGMGDFGQEVARTLSSEGAEVIAVDSDANLIEDIKDDVAQAVCLDATDENALRSLGIEGMEAAIVAMGANKEAGILITTILREMGLAHIIARAVEPLHGRILERVGATRIIYPEIQMARQIAKSLIASTIVERVSFSADHSLVEIIAPSSFWNKSILQTGIRSQFNILIVAILRKVPEVKDNGEIFERTKFISVPGPLEKIEGGDRLLVVGHDDDIERLAQLVRQSTVGD